MPYSIFKEEAVIGSMDPVEKGNAKYRNGNSAVSVMFVFKVPTRNHGAFLKCNEDFEKYKKDSGIASEHYIVYPLPKGKFDGWRGVEEAIESEEDEETWVLFEHYPSRALRTKYLSLVNDPDHSRHFKKLTDLASNKTQIMNELFVDSWEGYRK